ncbi:ABC-2 type transport system ATP-binding protein [Gracilibacillus ureilyticus]|uniref:ABC-2 type transport system ATP-binding protein n=1 Tax=Gracilibacillus ureilyticus TaxID=531814 RepID=A0A1H9NR92_9BACI|nr:ABC transporter ATP-binding protein [Gracilibacillus ureilyticus]SER37853.1 ABC-2 type transport system ATP-binding protein [Gracilibacillus ureilyticus]
MDTLQFQDVCVNIGENTILKDVSFSLGKGYIVALIGHNGAGKSTIMKTIMGWQEKRDGSISINSINQDESFLAYKKQIAYIPEEPFLLSELTAMQHFQLYGQSYGLDEQELMEKVEHLTKLFEINDKLNEYPESLSKGMRQKVQTICALLPEVALLLIDEPFMGLDIHAANDLERLIKNKANSGTSILLTSHQLERVEDLADKYLMLHKGELIEHGDMKSFEKLTRRTTE